MAEPLRHRFRVRYSECDVQGVVFNAHYLAYFDVGITELWRAAFGSYAAMMQRGIDLVVAEAQVRFERPARFDDELLLEVSVRKLGRSSMITEHHLARDAQTVARGTLRHVFVELRTMGKTSIPDWARSALAPWTFAEGPSLASEATASASPGQAQPRRAPGGNPS